MSETQIPQFIVMTSSAKVRGKARQFGRYRNVAIVETDGAAWPRQISERDKHVVRVVRHYGACSEGTTARCEYRRVLADAETNVERLNAENNC